MHLDVASAADWQAAVAHSSERFGELDILINNAAILVPRVPVEERTEEEWDRVMAFNAKGVFLGTKTAIQLCVMLVEVRSSTFLLISGIGQTLTQQPAYAASKGAIRVFFKSWQRNTRRQNWLTRSTQGPDSAMFGLLCRRWKHWINV